MRTQNHCKLFSTNRIKDFITILRYSRRHVIHDVICNRRHSACCCFCCCFGLTNHSEASSLWLVRQDRATINSGSPPSCGANFCSDRWLHRPRWVGWPVRYLDIYLFYVYGQYQQLGAKERWCSLLTGGWIRWGRRGWGGTSDTLFSSAECTASTARALYFHQHSRLSALAQH